jgi:hypothetical protein
MVILTDADNNSSGVNAGPPCELVDNSDFELNQADIRTNNRATAIKGGPDNVEIFVIRYANPGDPDDLPPGLDTCSDPSQVGVWPGFGRDPDNDEGDRLLARCLASSSPGTKDHYYFTPTPAEIRAAFVAIARRLMRRLTA